MNNCKWTIEKCRQEALKYNRKRDFKKYSGSAYYFAEKNHILDEMCSHINNKARNFWTKERCHNEALKYETKLEFSIKGNVPYKKSLEKGWDIDICSHMKSLGNIKNRCIYSYIFSDNSIYIGLTYNIEERDKWRKLKKDDAVTIHIKETNLQPTIKLLTDYIDINDAKILENDYINKYRGDGWNVLNRIKGGGIGGKLKWTEEKCWEEALKYKTRTQFKKGSDSAYKSAKRNGWFDKISKHMIWKVRYWTIEDIKSVALEYKTRTEFCDGNKGAYTWARRHDILNDVCFHMNKQIL